MIRNVMDQEEDPDGYDSELSHNSNSHNSF